MRRSWREERKSERSFLFFSPFAFVVVALAICLSAALGPPSLNILFASQRIFVSQPLSISFLLDMNMSVTCLLSVLFLPVLLFPSHGCQRCTFSPLLQSLRRTASLFFPSLYSSCQKGFSTISSWLCCSRSLKLFFLLVSWTARSSSRTDTLVPEAERAARKDVLRGGRQGYQAYTWRRVQR